MLEKIISHYKVIEKLGEGGMSVLYIAEDMDINRKAVLKFLSPEMINDTDINLRFKREAKIAGSLSHPNIVTIYDIGVHQDQTFIAMEYVEGKNLNSLMKNDELTIERIINISTQICEGLNEAHNKGITHRDLKPENILIDEKGIVKIVDFGLAQIKNVSKGITKTGSTVGTTKYMSPEQVRCQKIDQRSDIWSFGVILYEMITGKYPFRGEYDASIFYSILNQPPEPLARYKAGIPEGFQRIIDKALDKNVETRYQHIDEMLSDIKKEGKYKSRASVNTYIKRNIKLRKAALRLIPYLITFLIILAIFYFFKRPLIKTEQPKHLQLTFNGDVSLAIYEHGDISTISPDGTFLAYFAKQENKKGIYLKDISGEQTFEIFKGMSSVSSLRWSPDGTGLLLSGSQTDDSSSSFILSKYGKKIERLSSFTPSYPPPYLCWSPNGSLIAGVSMFSKNIIIINRNNELPEKTIKLTGDFNWIYDIDWSSAVNRLVILTFTENSKKYALWSIKPDGTLQNKILESNKKIYSPRWSKSGEYIYYLQSNDETKDLMKVKISLPEGNTDENPEMVQSGLFSYGFSLTKDNKKLVYTKYLTYSNLWLFKLDSKGVYKDQKLTNGTYNLTSPSFAPDKKRISFINQGNIYTVSTDGNKINQVTFLKLECSSPAWSPDGKKIVFLSGTNVWSISSEGGSPVLFKNILVGAQVQWYSNSSIMYHKPGNRNFIIYNIKTSESKKLISDENVGWIFFPHISPDGQKIAVYWNRTLNKKDAKGLWIISPENSSQKLLLKGLRVIPVKWSYDGKWIYTYKQDDKTSIWIVPENGSMPRKYFTFPFDNIDINIDITPDGKQIVCTVPEINSDVWMIENFDPDVE